jgi:hypothetical protein
MEKEYFRGWSARIPFGSGTVCLADTFGSADCNDKILPTRRMTASNRAGPAGGSGNSMCTLRLNMGETVFNRLEIKYLRQRRPPEPTAAHELLTQRFQECGPEASRIR